MKGLEVLTALLVAEFDSSAVPEPGQRPDLPRIFRGSSGDLPVDLPGDLPGIFRDLPGTLNRLRNLAEMSCLHIS